VVDVDAVRVHRGVPGVDGCGGVTVERGSAQHGPTKDDQLKHEIENELRAARPTRAEEWRDPEMPDEEEARELGLDGPLRPEPPA
jgi:hypothetical protein